MIVEDVNVTVTRRGFPFSVIAILVSLPRCQALVGLYSRVNPCVSKKVDTNNRRTEHSRMSISTGLCRKTSVWANGQTDCGMFAGRSYVQAPLNTHGLVDSLELPFELLNPLRFGNTHPANSARQEGLLKWPSQHTSNSALHRCLSFHPLRREMTFQKARRQDGTVP